MTGPPLAARPAVSGRPATRPALAALRSGPLRRYLIGQLPSVTCSWAQVVALSWVVVERDPRALGWVVALQFLPSLVLGPWFGAVTDRHDRRRLLMLAEAGLGLVALTYALVSAIDRLTLPWICLLATVWGVINALDTPARRALVPMLVPAEQAASASALTGTIMLVGMTAGSALGAALVSTVGVTMTFVANAASFLADLAVLGMIRAGASPRVKRAPRQVRDGLAYVWRTPALRGALLTLAVVATLAFTVPPHAQSDSSSLGTRRRRLRHRGATGPAALSTRRRCGGRGDGHGIRGRVRLSCANRTRGLRRRPGHGTAGRCDHAVRIGCR
jgi:MFS family permease